MNLLPVLQEHNPLMSLCSMCPKPGNCCKDFHIYQGDHELTFWAWQPMKDAEAFLKSKELPFYPLRISKVIVTRKGYRFVTLQYSCPKLVNGLCSIYSERPNLCRKFIPTSGPICVFYKAA